uniref:Membrane protein, putative n=1 Tax=Babesia bovis TaxID=5865 RepID=S6B2T2_BABBO|nr:membrane protein, putative [Babesia bovis]
MSDVIPLIKDVGPPNKNKKGDGWFTFNPPKESPITVIIYTNDLNQTMAPEVVIAKTDINSMGTYTGFAISRENVLNYRISGVIDARRHESTLFIEPPNALLSEVESFRCNDNLWHYVIIHTVCIGAGVPTVTQTIYQEVMDGNAPTYKKLDSIDADAWAFFEHMRPK